MDKVLAPAPPARNLEIKEGQDTHPVQSVLSRVGDNAEEGIRGLLADGAEEGAGHAISDLLEENI